MIVVVNATTVTMKINIKQGGASQISPAMYDGKLPQAIVDKGVVLANQIAEENVKVTNTLLWGLLAIVGIPIAATRLTIETVRSALPEYVHVISESR